MSAIDTVEIITSEEYGSRYEEQSSSLVDSLIHKVAVTLFKLASYLTDPICKTHEFYRRIYVIDTLRPEAGRVYNLVGKVALLIGVIGWAWLATVTTLPGVCLRALASQIQKEPLLHVRGSQELKTLPLNRSFSLFSWNICCVGAGFSISDGGVLPWSFRIDDIVKKIVEKGADVNCLYETFDAKSAFYLCEQLKQRGYTDFYFNLGPRALGVTSGIFVASKYKIQNPEFTPFPAEMLIGRTKSAAKGVFGFDLESEGQSFARVFATHFQHSEEPEFPTPEEVEARRRQMELIVEKVNTVRDRCIVVTGDLNLDDREFSASAWKDHFEKNDRFGEEEKTWGGDEFCARLMGKRVSRPLNLDHTMIVKGTASSFYTSLVPVGFDGSRFKDGALSDHNGLFSEFVLLRAVDRFVCRKNI